MKSSPPLPLYYQLKQTILQKIEDNTWGPGDQLPSEKWFCETYNVSRVTVRKALDELILDGDIVRSRGKSATVAHKKMERSVSYLTSLYEEFSEKGFSLSSTILWSKTVYASKKNSEKLGIPENEPLLAIRRIRKVNNQPIADQTIYLVQKYVRELNPKALEEQSLYKILENEYHLSLSYGKQTIGASMPTKEQIKYLCIGEDVPVLTVERIAYLSDDTPIEYSVSNYVSDLYNITITLYR